MLKRRCGYLFFFRFLQFSGPDRERGVVLRLSAFSARSAGAQQQQRPRRRPRQAHQHHRPHQRLVRGERAFFFFSSARFRKIPFVTLRRSSCFPSQKFGDLTVRQIERLRCRHRIRVLQAHEDTAKENAVSRVDT